MILLKRIVQNCFVILILSSTIDYFVFYLDGSILDARHECLDTGSREIITGRLVLGHILAQTDVAHGGHVLGDETEELEDSLVLFFLRVQVDEQSLWSTKHRES